MIHNLFPVKIYKVQFPNDLDSLRNSLISKLDSIFQKSIENNQAFIKNNGLCSYNVHKQLHTLDELKPYVDFLNLHLPIYWNELGLNKSLTPKIVEMWANRYNENSYIESHNHSPITITSTFYLSKPENSGNLVLENPLETLLKYQPIDYSDTNNYHTWFQQELTIDEGDIILFPGWLRHRTTVNKSDKERIIISANILY